MRGNRYTAQHPSIIAGSIPARAGEPFIDLLINFILRVYPRACGGTFRATKRLPTHKGLSPRVRGNHRSIQFLDGRSGSIPARAGEPFGASVRRFIFWVYPRACGGTWHAGTVIFPLLGLSPRVRGNPVIAVVMASIPGSIPARAGEPRAEIPQVRNHRVYPRACGGTLTALPDEVTDVGLSPRVRGNLAAPPRFIPVFGSIPARAGEPSQRLWPVLRRWVYPRACGGT